MRRLLIGRCMGDAFETDRGQRYAKLSLDVLRLFIEVVCGELDRRTGPVVVKGSGAGPG